MLSALHGHQIGGNLQKSVQEITDKYAARGVTVDYTLFGHLHATAIGATATLAAPRQP